MTNVGNMSKLFVDQSIEINTPVSRVWEVLTAREYTAEWAPEFSGGSPLHIEFDWKPGSRVLWKDRRQNNCEGSVTALTTANFYDLQYLMLEGKGQLLQKKMGLPTSSLKTAKRYFMFYRVTFRQCLRRKISKYVS